MKGEGRRREGGGGSEGGLSPACGRQDAGVCLYALCTCGQERVERNAACRNKKHFARKRSLDHSPACPSPRYPQLPPIVAARVSSAH